MKTRNNFNLNQIIAERLKLFRLSKSLSQKDFAFLISVSPSVYSRIENGKKELSLSVVQHIIEICKMNLHDLFDFTDSIYIENTVIGINEKKTNLVLNITLSNHQFDIIKSLFLTFSLK